MSRKLGMRVCSAVLLFAVASSAAIAQNDDDQLQQALLGGDLDGALAELKRQLPPCRVELLIAFIEEANADYEFRAGEIHGY